MKLFVCVSVLTFAVSANAATIPFTEGFDTSSSSWRGNSPVGPDLTHVPTGGPGGSAYASTDFSFAGASAGDSATLHRGHVTFGSSGGAFAGNWITEGVTAFSVDVRHNAPVPLTYFTRFAGPGNFPGGIAVNVVPVLPNTWTTITFPIVDGFPFVSYEGTSFAAVFSNLGNIQVGADAPAALAGNPATFTFDIDNPTIVPEPATISLLGLGSLAILRKRRNA